MTRLPQREFALDVQPMPAVAVLHVPVAGARRRILGEVAWVPDARRPLSFSSPVVVLTPCPPLRIRGEGEL